MNLDSILLVLGSGGFVALLNYIFNRRNLNAQADSVIGKTYLELFQELKERIDRQDKIIKDQDNLIKSLRKDEFELNNLVYKLQKSEIDFRKREVELLGKIKTLEEKLSNYIKSNK